MLVRPMVLIHISNQVDPITFFTIESTFTCLGNLSIAIRILISLSHFMETFNMVP